MSHWYSLRLHSLYLLYLQKPVPTAQVKCTRSLTEINLDVTTSTYQSQSSQTPERHSSSPEQTVSHLRGTQHRATCISTKCAAADCYASEWVTNSWCPGNKAVVWITMLLYNIIYWSVIGILETLCHSQIRGLYSWTQYQQRNPFMKPKRSYYTSHPVSPFSHQALCKLPEDCTSDFVLCISSSPFCAQSILALPPLTCAK